MNVLRTAFVYSVIKLPHQCRFLRNKPRSSKSTANPGIDRLYTALEKEGINVDNNLEDLIEESELEVSNFGGAYTNYKKEESAKANNLRYNIIKQKYFKENFPNLLTWSEKEQIRYLHSQDPQEWTPERLSESFPVTPDVVKKLIKFPWKAASQERIIRHDNSAIRNWKMVLNDELKLPDELKKHVLKFSNRNMTPTQNYDQNKVVFEQQKPVGEFQAIVLQQNTETNHQNEHFNTENDQQSVENEKKNSGQQGKIKKSKHRITLEELKNSILKKKDSGDSIDMSDEILLEKNVTNSDSISIQSIENELQVNDEIMVENNEISLVNEKVELKKYPERIRIPKSMFVKGATYRVSDCYYDYDGRFLYRVPGMEN